MYFKVFDVVPPVSVTGGPVLARCASGMQFRAEVEDREERRIVRLAGRLERTPSPDLLRLCDETQKPVRLDLTDLLSADEVGLETLGILQSRGAELVGASPYLALQLETAQTRGTQEQHGSVSPMSDARGSRINKAGNTEDK
jgi:hypothetical protein